MPLIAGDNRKNRLKRSAPIGVSTTPTGTNEPSTIPTTPFAGTTGRPTLIKAAKNAGKSILRSAKIIRRSSEATIEARRRICDHCELQVFKNDIEYCGHRYFDVTLGKVKIEDVKGCGCDLRRKRADPKAICPKIPPEWESEPETVPESHSE